MSTSGGVSLAVGVESCFTLAPMYKPSRKYMCNEHHLFLIRLNVETRSSNQPWAFTHFLFYKRLFTLSNQQEQRRASVASISSHAAVEIVFGLLLVSGTSEKLVSKGQTKIDMTNVCHKPTFCVAFSLFSTNLLLKKESGVILHPSITPLDLFVIFFFFFYFF